MKKYIFITVLLITTSTLFAQTNKRFEKIKAHKIAFITNQLELTSTEAELFWPVYNKYEKEVHQLEVVNRKKLLKSIMDQGGLNGLSEREAQNTLTKLEGLRDAIHNVEKEKYSEIQKTLSAIKVLKLYKAEKDFKKELIKRLKERSQKRTR